MIKINKKIFLVRANKIYNHKYDYSNVICNGWMGKINILCPIHGNFQKNLGDHLQGQGCQKCSELNRADRWKIEEDKFLIDNYKTKGRVFCHQKLNKTIRTTRARAAILGLTRKINPRPQHPFINSGQWANLVRGAKERNLIVEISISDIYDLYLKQNKRCSLSGLELSCTRDYSNNEISVDRIDSSKGYTKDNIQIVHKDINKMKTDLSQKNFIKFCKLISFNNL